MAIISALPNTFTAGNLIYAANLQANFDSVVSQVNANVSALSGNISVTGSDITLSGTTGSSITNATLATVNSNVGTFGSNVAVPVVTVNAKGLITGVTTSAIASGQLLGSAATKAIFFNSATIGENLSIASGTNGLTAGPVTISNGYSVTIADGSSWSIV